MGLELRPFPAVVWTKEQTIVVPAFSVCVFRLSYAPQRIVVSLWAVLGLKIYIPFDRYSQGGGGLCFSGDLLCALTTVCSGMRRFHVGLGDDFVARRLCLFDLGVK